MKSPYEVLGVPFGADEATIKRAYKELVKKYHPDQYADSPLRDLASEKLQEVNQAYDTLMNELKNGRSAQWGSQQGYGQQGSFGQKAQGQQNQSQQGAQYGWNPFGNPYQQGGRQQNFYSYYPRRSCCTGNDLCLLCCADSCCECMGLDLCACC